MKKIYGVVIGCLAIFDILFPYSHPILQSMSPPLCLCQSGEEAEKIDLSHKPRKWTKEREEFLRVNIYLSDEELAKRLSETGKHFTPAGVKLHRILLGYKKKRPGGKKKWTEEIDDWLRENYKLYSDPLLARQIGKQFNISVTGHAVAVRRITLGLREVPYRSSKKWTSERNESLGQNYQSYSDEALVSQLSERFGMKTTMDGVTKQRSRLGLKRTPLIPASSHNRPLDFSL